ncbi:MAG: aquaporin [Pyrinomonadaceae bacterium]
MADLKRRAVAEAVGTAMLLAAVVGSGIMGERLALGNVAIALLANTIATGAALTALILTFGPVSGAHFNPAVTLADAIEGGLGWRDAPVYIGAQILGAFAGVAAAHLMFGEPLFFASRHAREGGAQMFSEFVATFGLLAVIWGCARRRSSAVAFAVGAYITAAYWFTASTSFANPAVTLARSASDTFAGIRPLDVPAFIAAQLAGAATATALFRWLIPKLPEAASAVVVPHTDREQEEQMMTDMKRALILCTGNSARSQMAEGLLRRMGEGRFEVFSAGTQPGRVNPLAIEAMREVGIDISAHRSKSVDEFLGQEFDYVITVCDRANENCPIFPGRTKRIHWSFDDPAAAEGDDDERMAVFRRVRDEIAGRLRRFVE